MPHTNDTIAGRKAALAEFYRLFYNERRFVEGAVRLSQRFTNHHPGAKGIGPAGMIDDFTRLGPPPSFHIEPVRMAADGDLVWVLGRVTGVNAGGLAVDIWRFDDDDLIVEHWDVFRRLEPGEDGDVLAGGVAAAP